MRFDGDSHAIKKNLRPWSRALLKKNARDGKHERTCFDI